MGPESSSIHHYLPGDYTLTARFRGDWNDAHVSDTTVTMEVIRNYGADNETRESITRRLHEAERVNFMDLKVDPTE